MVDVIESQNNDTIYQQKDAWHQTLPARSRRRFATTTSRTQIIKTPKHAISQHTSSKVAEACKLLEWDAMESVLLINLLPEVRCKPHDKVPQGQPVIMMVSMYMQMITPTCVS